MNDVRPQIGKRVKLNLVGQDGNAFALMGVFSRAAKKQGWTKAEVDFVIAQAQASDYDNLLRTLMSYCEPEEVPGA